MDDVPALAERNRIAAKWLSRIEEAKQRQKNWANDAEWAENAFLCGTIEAGEKVEGDLPPDFNIVHSNSATIIPAIYNSSPSPDIRPRHGNKDQMAKAFADALERGIDTQADDDSLNVELEETAQDVVVAGRGITRVKFEAQVTDEGVTGERVIYENVSWRDYLEGPAKRWSDVPWVAYRYYISQEEVDRLTDEGYKPAPNEEVVSEELDVSLWQIWCRETRRVYLVIEEKSRLISMKDDPYKLPGFFPQPSPIQPIKGTGRRLPVCPHKTYRQLSEELDYATRRINAVMKGLKVRGVIAGDAEVVELVATLGDNELAPAPDMASTLSLGGLEKAVMWWPVDQAIAVLQQLYVQREQVKQTIYEVTGISDIVRGASDPRETAEAQKVKTQWGSQRIKRMQRMIQSHVRDLYKLTAQLMAAHFTPQSLARAAGVQVTPELVQMMGQMDEYRIDVETDSTIRADLTYQRQEMAEFLRASGEYMSIMAPLIEKAPAATGAVMEMYASFAGSFQLGKRAEDALQQMVEMAAQAGQKPPPNPEAEERKANMMLEGQKLQLENKKLSIEAGKVQSAMASEQRKQSLAEQKAQADLLLKRMEVGIKARDLGLKVDAQALEQAKAEFDAIMKFTEAEIEKDQRRPVSLG